MDVLSDTDALAHELIDLAHAADRAVGAGRIVDAYYGDYTPDASNRSTDPGRLSDDFHSLASAAAAAAKAGGPASRLRDMEQTARGLGAFLAMQQDGRALPYSDAIEVILGSPLFVPTETELLELREKLSECLENLGSPQKWPDNLRHWQNQNSVNAEEYLNDLKGRATEYKGQLLDDVLGHILPRDQSQELLDASSVSYRFADTDEAWSAYHVYEGNSRSVIELNSRRQFDRENSALFASHEVYPGHHTQALIREHLYRAGELGVEVTLSTLNSPGNVLAEGIGDYARFLLNGEMSEAERAAYLADQLATQWRHRLGVAHNEGVISEQEAVTELPIRTGMDQLTATRSLRFAVEWKYYFPSYVIGLRHVRRLVGEHGKRVLRDVYTRESAMDIDDPTA